MASEFHRACAGEYEADDGWEISRDGEGWWTYLNPNVVRKWAKPILPYFSIDGPFSTLKEAKACVAQRRKEIRKIIRG